MTNVKYRRTDDHSKVYTAVRYGNEDRSWDESCVPRVAKFVLGIDSETRVTLKNERIMDVVRPIEKTWDPKNWMADIEVADWVQGQRYRVRLGDWLVKDTSGQLHLVTSEAFSTDYEEIVATSALRNDYDKLVDSIQDCLPWGPSDKKLARRIADVVVSSGWKKG